MRSAERMLAASLRALREPLRRGVLRALRGSPRPCGVLPRLVEHPLLARSGIGQYTRCMGKGVQRRAVWVRSLCGRLLAWVKRPYAGLFRIAFPAFVFGGVCLALPPWVGLILFAPLAVALGFKTAFAIRAIVSLDLVTLVDDEGRPCLDTQADRLQRAWALGSAAIVSAVSIGLVARAVFGTFPQIVIPDAIATYLTFTAVLVGGFLLFYFLALRFDKTVLRGLTSITVTLPAFFIVVVVASILLSWAMKALTALGFSAEGMLQSGFDWLYEVQRILGMATDYFLKQDSIIIAASIVLAALLLLLYTYSVPFYWMRSVSRWLKGISLVAAAFGAAVIVFAGVWLVDVQRFAAESASGQLASAIDSSVLDSQSSSLAQYKSDDLIALIKAFVLPYTVGVFVANAVVALRKGKAKDVSNAIIDKFAADGAVDEDELPALKRRYLYYGGSQTLWDIALRSIGHDIPLPHPFAPRKLTIKERITGELADPAPAADSDAKAAAESGGDAASDSR